MYIYGFFFRVDIARQLDDVALRSCQHEATIAVPAIVGVLSTVVVHLEGDDAGVVESQRLRARLRHVHIEEAGIGIAEVVVHLHAVGD